MLTGRTTWKSLPGKCIRLTEPPPVLCQVVMPGLYVCDSAPVSLKEIFPFAPFAALCTSADPSDPGPIETMMCMQHAC